MKIMVFDTETTGLPKSKIMNQDTLHHWPHIVQLSYLIYDISNNQINKTSDHIIKLLDDIVIPDEASNIHGITTQMSKEKGILLLDAFHEFFEDLKTVDKLVGHNISFDINMIKIELLRFIHTRDKYNIPKEGLKKHKYDLYLITNFENVNCTLQETIELCNILALNRFGKTYVKYPKLMELHEKLFGSVPNNLHNSLVDILITLRCFMKVHYNVDMMKKCKQFNKTIKELNIL